MSTEFTPMQSGQTPGAPQRDAHGRYTHVWGWQGFDAEGNQWSFCECCHRWSYSHLWMGAGLAQGPERLYATPECKTVVYEAVKE